MTELYRRLDEQGHMSAELAGFESDESLGLFLSILRAEDPAEVERRIERFHEGLKRLDEDPAEGERIGRLVADAEAWTGGPARVVRGDDAPAPGPRQGGGVPGPTTRGQGGLPHLRLRAGAYRGAAPGRHRGAGQRWRWRLLTAAPLIIAVGCIIYGLVAS